MLWLLIRSASNEYLQAMFMNRIRKLICGSALLSGVVFGIIFGKFEKSYFFPLKKKTLYLVIVLIISYSDDILYFFLFSALFS